MKGGCTRNLRSALGPMSKGIKKGSVKSVRPSRGSFRALFGTAFAHPSVGDVPWPLPNSTRGGSRRLVGLAGGAHRLLALEVRPHTLLGLRRHVGRKRRRIHRSSPPGRGVVPSSMGGALRLRPCNRSVCTSIRYFQLLSPLLAHSRPWLLRWRAVRNLLRTNGHGSSGLRLCFRRLLANSLAARASPTLAGVSGGNALPFQPRRI